MKKDRSIIDYIKITDNILFTSVFENINIIKKFIEVVLKFRIIDIKIIQKEKVVDSVGKSRGVRFDVYVEDDNNKIYDIEIQTSDEKDLLKRLRYYQGCLDINHLNKGDSFNDLKTTYIIFICMFNPFKNLGLDNYIYNIEPYIKCNDTVVKSDDDSHKIVINTKYDITKIGDIELKSFIELMNDGFKPVTKSDLTDMIVNEANRIKKDEEWSEKYMEVMEQYALEKIKNVVINMLLNSVNDDVILKCAEITQEQLNEIKKEVQL